MAVTATTRPAPLAFRLLERLSARWARLRAVRVARRELATLSDRDLADLGLHRGSIDGIVLGR